MCVPMCVCARARRACVRTFLRGYVLVRACVRLFLCVCVGVCVLCECVCVLVCVCMCVCVCACRLIGMIKIIFIIPI